MSTGVGFIGLGHMGAPMCAQVVRAGFDVTAFDLRAEAREPARASGAAIAASAAECAAAADVLVTMLPGPAQVEDVLLGSGGVLAALPEGGLIADMSTSSPALGRRIAAAARERGIAFVDAPVADAKRAAEGRLHIMVGGEAADVDRARPVLTAMGGADRVTHIGPVGSGYAIKLLVNLQWFVHAVAAAEALAVGLRAGIDAGTLHAVFASGPARSSFLEHEALEVLQDGEYAERFPLGLVRKDLALAIDLAQETGVAVELSALTDRIYERARQRFGDGEGELGAVKLYEELAGTPFRFAAAEAPAMVAEPILRIASRPETILRPGGVDDLPELVARLGGRAAFVITDRGVAAAGIAGRVVDALRARGLAAESFDVHGNPSLADVSAGAAAARAFGPAVLVALGGGSPMDAAKAIALALGSPPIIAVPTTAGTGAETNGFGVIEDGATGRKVYPGDDTTVPRYAVLDPELGLSAPPAVTAACGLDALAHAIESLQARTANAYAAGLALEAVRLIAANLPRAVEDGEDADARCAMLLAAHLAALAFGTTGLGTAHAVGHALSARYGTPHGVALAAVLPHVVRLNRPARPDEAARIAAAAGWGGGGGGLAAAVASFQERVGLRPGLRGLGVPWDDLGGLAERALEDVVILNAPRVPAREELTELLRAAF